MTSSLNGRTPLSQHAHAVDAAKWQGSNNYSFKEDPHRDNWVVFLLSTAGSTIDEGR
jgi:hypothetical protein